MTAEHTTRAETHYGYELAPGRKRAASALRRRNRAIRFMTWACAALGAGLVVTFAIFAGLFESDTPVVKAVAPQEAKQTLNVGELQFTGFDKKNQAYAIAADTAEQDKDQPNIIHLHQVRAEIKVRGSGDVIFVKANIGKYDTDAETLELADNIKLLSTNGYTAELQSAQVWLDEGRVHSAHPVVVRMSNGTIWSNAVDLWDRGKRIVFKNRVRVLFQERGGKADAG